MKNLKKKIVACYQINKKIPDLHCTKKHYWSFITKKNTKSVKQLEVITSPPKPFENQNIVNIKPVFTKLRRNYRRL